MKVKTKVKADPFTPIKFVLTIESERELCDLMQRLKINPIAIEAHNPTRYKYTASDHLKRFAEEVEAHIVDRNLLVI